MLITTYHGILVNSQHVTFIALRRHNEENLISSASGIEATYRVVLFLVSGDAIIAAEGLTRPDAEFLRRDIGRLWSEGCASVDVATTLRQRHEGAYYAEETGARPS